MDHKYFIGSTYVRFCGVLLFDLRKYLTCTIDVARVATKEHEITAGLTPRFDKSPLRVGS